MKRRIIRWVSCLAAIGASCHLSGCSSAPTRSYTLYPVPPRVAGPVAAPLATVNTYGGTQVRIDAVHVPPTFDRVEVVTTIARGEMKINDSAHWAASLPQLARQVLSTDLAWRLPPGAVVAPHLSKPLGTLGIDVDIQVIDIADGGASLYVDYSLGVTKTDSRRATGTVRSAGGSSPAATADALSELLGVLADSIASEVLSPAKP